MKKFMLLFLCALCLFGLPAGKAFAQQTTVTAHVFAEVIEALTAAETSQLNFGRFYPQTNGGSIIIRPDGLRSVTGDVSTLGIYSAASFTITGLSDATFSITLPPKPATVTNLSNSKTMDVTNWESDPPSGTGTGLLTGGAQMVKVGATLVVRTMNDNPVGMYSGTYSISFNYN